MSQPSALLPKILCSLGNLLETVFQKFHSFDTLVLSLIRLSAQIRAVPRPTRVEHDAAKGDPVLMDILWSDPAESDADRGIQVLRQRVWVLLYGSVAPHVFGVHECSVFVSRAPIFL